MVRRRRSSICPGGVREIEFHLGIFYYFNRIYMREALTHLPTRRVLQQQLQQIQKLLKEVKDAARLRFENTDTVRIWYSKLSGKAWKAIVINTSNKVVLEEGPIRTTALASLRAIRNQLNAAVRAAANAEK